MVVRVVRIVRMVRVVKVVKIVKLVMVVYHIHLLLFFPPTIKSDPMTQKLLVTMQG